LTVDDTYILGHEASGIVLECGPAVTNFKPGDRVAIEPGVSCGKCFVCLDGNYHLCTEQQFTGVYPYHGSLQRYLIHPAKWLHKMPDSMTFVQGSLLEPLSVVLHAIDEVNIKLGRGLAICGAGPIGLVSLACAKASGAWPIVITDVEPKRLRFAEEFVPGCKTYLVDRNKDPLGNATAIRAMFGSDEYSAPLVVLECTGIENSVTTACYLPRKKGTLMVIGVGKAMIHNIPFMHLNMNEIQLKFSNRYRDTWPPAISMLAGGVVNLDKIVTHTFPLEKSVDAFNLAGDVSQGSIKTMIVDEVDV